MGGLCGMAPVTVRLCSQAHPLALVIRDTASNALLRLRCWTLDEPEQEAVVTHGSGGMG